LLRFWHFLDFSEKPSGQYLSLIVMSHWLDVVWIRIWDILIVLHYHMFVWGITFICLVVCRWQVRHGRQWWWCRRPGAEDRGWSSTCQVLGGWMIRRSDDTVCGLHHARGYDEHRFLSWASKLRSTVCQWFNFKITGTVCQWFGLKPTGTGFSGFASKPTAAVFPSLTSKSVASDFFSLASWLMEVCWQVVHLASS
jgi:hypothetical protein